MSELLEEHTHPVVLGVLEQIREELATIGRASGRHGYMHPLYVRTAREAMGHEAVAVSASQVTQLNAPRGAKYAKITVEGNSVRIREDGGSPETAVSPAIGHLLNAGDVYQLDTDPLLLRALALGAGAILQVTYYS